MCVCVCFEDDVSINQEPIFKHMEVNSALMVQDLKYDETNLVVVDLFKYSMVSICFHIRSRTNLTLLCLQQKRHVASALFI